MDEEKARKVDGALERARICIYMVVNEALIERGFAGDLDVHVERDGVTKAIVVHVIATVFSRRLYCVHANYPADWWQAFKARWWPAWALRRWPVRYITLEADIRALFPTASLAGPLAGKHEPYIMDDMHGPWSINGRQDGEQKTEAKRG